MIRPNNPRVLISSLGFCCFAAFFAANKKVPTSLLADRLGVPRSTLRYHKNKPQTCISAPSCLIANAPPHLKDRLRKRIK